MSSGPAVTIRRSSRGLYKYLLRKIAALPDEANQYYRHRIRQEYNTHSDESDPERIEQIIQRAVQDVDWIVAKYKEKQ